MIGAHHPIVFQSMTTTTPDDLPGSLAQIRALRAAGCRVVRLAVPSQRAADALPELRRRLRASGLRVALVADVHFSPDLALAAAPYVEKVRINPGNFAAGPAEARRHVEPLVAALRAHGAALRIGVNHGSLAPRIVAALGHGPEAMVEAALEYLRLCRELDFGDTIVSLKASNPALMVEANRQLARRMAEAGFDAPIHLGVTEAGEGVEGALRSAVAMGALLAEGIGDTIRVSLSGDPVAEIPVCRALLRGVRRAAEPRPAMARGPLPDGHRGPAPALLVRSVPALRSAARRVPHHEREAPTDALALRLPRRASPRAIAALACDLQRRRERPALWLEIEDAAVRTLVPAELRGLIDRVAFRCSSTGPRDLAAQIRRLRARASREGLREPALIWSGRPLIATGHRLARALGPTAPGGERPLLLPQLPRDPWEAAVTLGSLLLDGVADGVLVSPSSQPAPLGLRCPAHLAAEILQATRRRIHHAEFIACPGCGRLHYDLAGTVRRLKRRLAAARGVRIAVMGCAVNGPGEMADADFGYVGAGPGRVDLYVGRCRMRRGLSPHEADRALIELLRQRGLLR